MYIAAAIPVVLLAVWGLVDLVRRVEEYLLNCREKRYHITVIPLQGHVENVEYIVRSAVSEVTAKSHCISGEVVLVDNGVDNETMALCKNMCKEVNSVVLCDPFNVKEVITDHILFAKS